MTQKASIEKALVCVLPEERILKSITPSVGIPDHARALLQHQKYCETLEKCGLAVSILPHDTAFPGNIFISDMAVVTEHLAVIANFSDENPRQGEQRDISAIFAGSKFIKFITAPGCLNARDVLQIENRFYIALSAETNQEGAAQLAFFLKEFGHAVEMTDLKTEQPLQLKSSAVYLGNNMLLVREELARHFSFLEYDKITVPYGERGAAKSVMVNGTLIMPSGYADTLAAVQARNIPVICVNISEFEKINAGLSNLSLLSAKPERDAIAMPPVAQKRRTA